VSDTLPAASDLKVEAGAPDEIEVTPAMIVAGAGAYYSGDLRFKDAGEIAAEIYRAMESARRLPATRAPDPTRT
jgi:hypothetical protein